jgi:hypothetical protein
MRKYYAEIKLKAQEEGIELPGFRENIFKSYCKDEEKYSFYMNWLTVLDTDTKKRKADKIAIYKFNKRIRLIYIFIILMFVYIAFSSVVVLML